MLTMLNHLTHLLVIIGSAKCGTSSLARHLAAHPQISIGRQKEPRFFSSMGETAWTGPASEGFCKSLITTPEEYAANFPDLRSGQWAVDASTDYIWRPEATERLKEFSRGRTVRLICTIRDPIDRAISEYNHTLRHGWEKLSFWEAVEAEPERVRAQWHPLFYHRRRSTVADDVERMHNTFGDDLMIIDYADFRDPAALLGRIHDFLGISAGPETEVQIAQSNRSYLPRNRIAERLLKSPMIAAVGRTLLPHDMRRAVRRLLHTDARKLKTVQPDEIDRFRELMQDEIARCRKSPLIPTENWRLERPEVFSHVERVASSVPTAERAG
jgi:hypothetical protein